MKIEAIDEKVREILHTLWNGINHALVLTSTNGSERVIQTGYEYHDRLTKLLNSSDRLPQPRKIVDMCKDLAEKEIFDQFQQISDTNQSKQPKQFTLSNYGRNEFREIALTALEAFSKLGYSPGRFIGMLGGKGDRVLIRPRMLVGCFLDSFLDMDDKTFLEAQQNASFPTADLTRGELARKLNYDPSHFYKNIPTLERLEILQRDGDEDKRYIISSDMGPVLEGLRKSEIISYMDQAWKAGLFQVGDSFTVAELRDYFNEFKTDEDEIQITSIYRMCERFLEEEHFKCEDPYNYNAKVQVTEKGRQIAADFFLPLYWHFKNKPSSLITLKSGSRYYGNRSGQLSQDMKKILADYLELTRPKK